LGAIRYAAIATAVTLLLGYPLAYGIARAPARWRGVLLMLVILPFWTSFLIRVYAWIGLLKENGIVNHALMSLGLIDAPLRLINNDFSVILGLVYAYLPFMVLPLYAQLEKLDPALSDAAAVAAGHRRGRAAGVHPGGRRVRHPRSARRTEHADDRQNPVGRVLHQP